MSGSKIGITPRQFCALDAVRSHADQAHKPPAAWISDVVEFASARDDCAPAAAKRALSDLQRAGLLDKNRWRVWLTDAGREFLNAKKEGS